MRSVVGRSAATGTARERRARRRSAAQRKVAECADPRFIGEHDSRAERAAPAGQCRAIRTYAEPHVVGGLGVAIRRVMGALRFELGKRARSGVAFIVFVLQYVIEFQ